MGSSIHSFALLELSFTILLLLFTSKSTTAATTNGGGLTVNLIHRDSPDSPFYNPHETPAQRLGNSFRRSDARVHRFTHMLHLTTTSASSNSSTVSYFSDEADSPLTKGDGEYLMNISIGTPPFPIMAISDTGSDVVWTQCKPCASCYEQDAPLFDPNFSTTYRTVSCWSDACKRLESDGTFCPNNNSKYDEDVCRYQVNYGDRSITKGVLASDTLTLGSSSATGGGRVRFPRKFFGCGHNNSGTFSHKGSGLVGLGGGPASLVSQLLGSFAHKKFSSCMVPQNAARQTSTSTSTLHFGENAVVYGNNVVSTPLIYNPSHKTFYFLQLEAFSVGNVRVTFPAAPLLGGGSGNIFIDSGTTTTRPPTSFFSVFANVVDGQVTGGTKTSDPQGFLSLCYVRGSGFSVPTITAHFKGADVVLGHVNTFIATSNTTTCLAFSDKGGLSIYGNIAQQNFLIGYDLQKRSLSFKPTDCTKN